jgi:superfamily II DNA or RNA helicase
MILRPRQTLFVDRCEAALEAKGNTLAVAPTGAGKTVMLSALVGRELKKGAERAIILQHRDELTAQNRLTFHAVNGFVGSTGVIDASMKEYDQPISFAMVPTVTRNVDKLWPTDVAIVDEAHHITAVSYRRVLDKLYDLNPDMKLAGFTATPQRGDKTPLKDVFDNVADQITVIEMVRAGLLVKPRISASARS